MGAKPEHPQVSGSHFQSEMDEFNSEVKMKMKTFNLSYLVVEAEEVKMLLIKSQTN